MKRSINLFLLCILFSACKQRIEVKQPQVDQEAMASSDPVTTLSGGMQVLVGETMGTTYSIKYSGNKNEDFKKQVDKLLEDVNLATSTYIDNSIISAFNKMGGGQDFKIESYAPELQVYFMDNYNISAEIHTSSKGRFDPTVMPIVNYWGFGYDGRKKITKIDSNKVKDLLNFVGWDKISYDAAAQSWTKTNKKTELDFSAVAKGYAVDKIANLFLKNKIEHFYIEIGGECRAQGNKSGKPWVIGVSQPDPKAGLSDLVTKLDLVNTAVATSGNYRNFYVLNDQIISHTINPRSGFPEKNNLLSATVFHPSCARADALATACMTMGFDEAFVFIDEMPEAECYLIYTSSRGQVIETMSKGVADWIH